MRRFSASGRYHRRVLRAYRDWAMAVRQIDGASLRRRHEEMKRLGLLTAPPDVRADHEAVLAAWHERLEDREQDPAVRVARGLELRAALDELGARASGHYGAELAQLVARMDDESPKTGRDFERESLHALRRIERARPPAAFRTEHDEIVRLLQAHIDTQRQLYASLAARDAGALALAEQYGRGARELYAAATAFYDRVRG